MQKNKNSLPVLGFGLGLRIPHYAHIFEHWPQVDWFEIISENFMDTDGRPRRNLARIAERYPVVMHGIALSIGTVDPLNSEYLGKLKKLAQDVQPAWISDHLCWTGVAHKNSHDLLPVPYTEEALKHIIQRIRQVQDFLGRPIALENPSTYLEFSTSQIPEAEFIAYMAKESGCNLLLDINNVYVSCYNHRLDPKAYIDALPLDKVLQVHLSGHSNMGTHIIDTHDDHVVDEVWALYRYATHKAGRVFNTMIEWDDNIPEFGVLYSELGKAKEAARLAEDYGALPNLVRERLPYVVNQATPLVEVQKRFQEAILRGFTYDSSPEDWIHTKADFVPAEQLAVYINAYRLRLMDVTAEDYPVLKHHLGEKAFDTLMADFVNSVPSHHFNISRHSARLPVFLAKHECATPFALELVSLENVIAQLMDAPETLPLVPEHLQGMTAEALMNTRLYPRAALQLFAFEYSLNAYYCAVKEEKNPTEFLPESSFLAVFRHEDTVWRMDLGAQEYQLLSIIFDGKTIGEALQLLQQRTDLTEDELGKHLSHWFSRWMRNGLLAKYEYRETVPERNTA